MQLAKCVRKYELALIDIDVDIDFDIDRVLHL